jgi:hypothetical protein
MELGHLCSIFYGIIDEFLSFTEFKFVESVRY